MATQDKLDLYAVQTASKEVLNTFFSKKTDAKAKRDEIIAEGGTAHVMKGPDHPKLNPASTGLRAAIEKRQARRRAR